MALKIIFVVNIKTKHVDETQVNKQLLKSLFKFRFKTIGIVLVFCSVAAIITFLTPKKFSAEGLVYPTSSNNIKEVAANPEFGFELQADKLIQLFESQEMQTKIVRQFDLINYYELDTTSIDWKFKLNKKFKNDFTFSRTKYLSIIISAKTKDPYLSANIVNSMINYVDTVRQNIFFENIITLQQSFSKQVTIHQATVDSLLLAVYYNNGEKTENPLVETALNQINYAKQTGEPKTGDEIIASAMLNNYSIALSKIVNEYTLALNQLNHYKLELAKTTETLTLPFPAIYKIKMAEVDLKKSSPSLFMNIIYGGLIGLLFSIIFISVKHNWARIKDSLTD